MQKLPLVGSLLLLLACGGPSAAPKTAPPLTEEQAKSFEDGIDFVASLEGIEGKWRDEWDRELQIRVGAADLIALVTVRTLRTDTDPEQKVTHRLHARIDRELVGDVGEEIELAVRADQPGFNSVHQNLARIGDKQFVAYVRKGPERLHWHLSPASEEVVSETERTITMRRSANNSGNERVVVHNN